MEFPNFDPIAITAGPIAIRWYALSYVAGILGAWHYIRFMVRHSGSVDPVITDQQMEGLVFWTTLGIIIGGRLGYVLFYKPIYFSTHPTEILFLWHGGMSFHGGLLGVALVVALFSRYHQISLLALGDLLGCAAPIGIMLGRIGNFINGELYGRPTSVSLPWAMVFPKANGIPVPRHPSQLYEAFLEGLMLFGFLYLLWKIKSIRDQQGALFGFFLVGYGLARVVAEYFREPDANIGFFLGGTTMGQWLSSPMIGSGCILLFKALRRYRYSS